MEIRVEKFCALSTSQSWQAWLFNFNEPLFKSFLERLQKSRGCSQNTVIMTDVLKEIERIDGGIAKLHEFLHREHPTVLATGPHKRPSRPQVRAPHNFVPQAATPTEVAPTIEEIFPHYDPDILTYPRRMVLHGPNRFMLRHDVYEFVRTKYRADYAVFDKIAFIEYFNPDETELVSQVPRANWAIQQWRMRSKQKS